MSQTYLVVKNLSYILNNQAILQDISFSIEKGDILVIIGPNGSGKTTLLKNIIGVLNPTSGEVLIEGKSPKTALGKIGYVPQKFEFDRLTPITVYEFMALEKCSHSSHGTEYISFALEQVGLKGSEKKKLGVLSGGEFQRVMIARALLHEKELLIFDEPAAGIDLAGEETVYSLIASINQKTKATCIIVSHELSIVNRYAKNVLCLNKKLLCFGRPEETINSEKIKNLYGAGAGLYQHHNHQHQHSS